MVTGSPTLTSRLPSLHIQAQEHSSRPRILRGMGEEGGEPIYRQAHGFKSGRLPRQLHLNTLLILMFWNKHTRSVFSREDPSLLKTTIQKYSRINSLLQVVSAMTK